MRRSLADPEACREKKQCDPQNPPHDGHKRRIERPHFLGIVRQIASELKETTHRAANCPNLTENGMCVCVEQGNLDGVQMVLTYLVIENQLLAKIAPSPGLT
jgi:hypothetical protein